MTIATIEVNLSALKHNVTVFRKCAPNSQIMAIVKANAYSHGKEKIAQTLDNHIDYFGVARLDEAIKLRLFGIKSPIVLLEGFFCHEDPLLLLKYDLQPVIHCKEQIIALTQLQNCPKLNIWFKFDSGMHRLGFQEEAKYYFNQLTRCHSIQKPINIISHFCCADDLSSTETTMQMKKFDQFIDSIQEKNWIGKKSIAASGGILAWPDSHYDVIRPGIALYGVSPFEMTQQGKSTGKILGLQPVMKLKSEIITVRSHKKGDGVGYGLTWKSEKETKLGVVAMGYGDGYPKNTKSNTHVLVNGRLVPIVGRVAMDMIIIDLGIDSHEKSGDEVIFWGIDELTVEEIAANSNMSAYELLTRLTQRAQLRYIE